MAEKVERLTEQEQKEWVRGYPYSMAFTDGVVHRLSQAAAQVARLEEKLKAVELARDQCGTTNHMMFDLKVGEDCPFCSMVRAALSDTAGEGWPEVKIQWRRGKGSHSD